MDHTQLLISVVDDDRSVRRALRRLLQTGGYAAELFASGKEFLSSSAPGRTACLILDIQLGATTGFELQAELAAGGSVIPIIFISAYDDAATSERIAESGAAAYLRKPFEEQDLLDAIRRAVDTGDSLDHAATPGETT
ncbi:MAG TPA: response regulator [Candidatus Dormibacteraeota bacterium]|jgi:FixJ family two-component response regulator|nr:response regulator [Candidatus Dormibacteraeota bacterium]